MVKTSLERKIDKNPKETAGIFSLATFSWMNPILKIGYQRPLNKEDLYELSYKNQAENFAHNINKAWKREIKTAKEFQRPPRLWRALLHIHSWQTYVLIFLLKFTLTATYVTNAIFVWYLLEVLGNDALKIHYKVLVGAGLSLSIFISFLVSNHHDFQTYKAGMGFKIALIASIHKEVIIPNSHKCFQ